MHFCFTDGALTDVDYLFSSSNIESYFIDLFLKLGILCLYGMSLPSRWRWQNLYSSYLKFDYQQFSVVNSPSNILVLINTLAFSVVLDNFLEVCLTFVIVIWILHLAVYHNLQQCYHNIVGEALFTVNVLFQWWQFFEVFALAVQFNRWLLSRL